mmetsp:Transcript_30757/g.80475  ORF Transcript_30757/g.80475 Transcript_30757/m.80475 type:complete len:196 (-) Transcript_30757:1908-2495(-)
MWRTDGTQRLEFLSLSFPRGLFVCLSWTVSFSFLDGHPPRVHRWIKSVPMTHKIKKEGTSYIPSKPFVQETMRTLTHPHEIDRPTKRKRKESPCTPATAVWEKVSLSRVGTTIVGIGVYLRGKKKKKWQLFRPPRVYDNMTKRTGDGNQKYTLVCHNKQNNTLQKTFSMHFSSWAFFFFPFPTKKKRKTRNPKKK